MGSPANPGETERRAYMAEKVHLEEAPKNVEVWCGADHWVIDRAALASHSKYFGIACYLPQALSNRIRIPVPRSKYVKAMFTFMQDGTYTGQLADPSPRAILEPLPSLSIKFSTTDPRIVRIFPEMRNGWVVKDHPAVKAIVLMTFHAEFNHNQVFLSNNSDGSEYTCYVALLPNAIKLDLLAYLAELSSRNSSIDTNPVFHAKMYEHATKYMLHELQATIVTAFRFSATPWLDCESKTEPLFLLAIGEIWKRRSLVDTGDALMMREALVEVMGANWAWMKHQKNVLEVVGMERFDGLKSQIVREVERQKGIWERELSRNDNVD